MNEGVAPNDEKKRLSHVGLLLVKRSPRSLAEFPQICHADRIIHVGQCEVKVDLQGHVQKCPEVGVNVGWYPGVMSPPCPERDCSSVASQRMQEANEIPIGGLALIQVILEVMKTTFQPLQFFLHGPWI